MFELNKPAIIIISFEIFRLLLLNTISFFNFFLYTELFSTFNVKYKMLYVPGITSRYVFINACLPHSSVKYIPFYIFIFCIVYIISVTYNARGSITVDTTHSSTVIT